MLELRYALQLIHRRRQGAAESGAVAGRFDPDSAAVHFDDAFDQHQTDSGTLVVLVQAVEQAEDLLLVLRLSANPAVGGFGQCA